VCVSVVCECLCESLVHLEEIWRESEREKEVSMMSPQRTKEEGYNRKKLLAVSLSSRAWKKKTLTLKVLYSFFLSFRVGARSFAMEKAEEGIVMCLYLLLVW